MNPVFTVNNLEITKVWHCFGNYMHKVDKKTALEMLNASKTNVIPINTHLLDHNKDPDSLQVGFAGVKISEIKDSIDLKKYKLMLNINHQISSEDAVKKTQWAYEMTGEKIIKLEVLNKDLATSNDEELIKAVQTLKQTNPELILMPLLSNNYNTAKKLVELGCPLLRVMGSAIGSGKGIENKEEFKKICTLGVPVVLDGGVNSAEDFHAAESLGAIGCLINSALFVEGRDPVAYLRKFRQDCFK